MNALALCLAVALSSSFAAGKVTLTVTAPELVQGAPEEVSVRIANGTGSPILLQRVSIPATGAALDWSRQVCGSLSYDDKANLFVHNTMAQQACTLQSSPAVVAPGATGLGWVTFVPRDVGHIDLVVQVTFHVLSSDGMAAHVYVARNASPGRVEYAPASLENLTKLAHETHGITRFVTRGLPKPSTAQAKMSLTVVAPEYPLDQALARIVATGREPDRNHAVTGREYDPDHECWLLGTKSGLWVVDRTHAEFHAGLGIREYQHLYTISAVAGFWYVPESLPEKVRAAVSARVRGYQPKGDMGGVRFMVPGGEVLALASDLSKLGLRVVLSDLQLHTGLSIARAE